AGTGRSGWGCFRWGCFRRTYRIVRQAPLRRNPKCTQIVDLTTVFSLPQRWLIWDNQPLANPLPHLNIGLMASTLIELDEPKPRDRLARRRHALRISVTDRCNFRCVYCMPKEVFGKDYQFLERKELLTFEEIVRLARAFNGLGVEKIRLTGGEAAVPRNLGQLMWVLAAGSGLGV